ncbi:4Fe-4S binding protein [Peptoniphilus rhinitidis]|uniref:4Fe-4S binding protein n=1 Tax=Peptoniphilus rhinitidis TaxID=1175452 RepID=UPI000288ED46|nr:4Fe-4S binding protein [Peptoniphilus rhinitidis]
MDNLRNKRNFVQGFFTIFTNLYITNFFKGTIYTGKLKSACVPGLNCYSCPGAALSCPIGSFQAVVGSSKFKFSYYVTGLMLLFGTLFGRLICGFLCPFGFFQDLLYKIPTKKFSTRKFSFLKYIKYFILIFVVWICGVIFTDELGIASPYFCKYICPQGILEGGVPLSIANKSIRASLGNLFLLKSVILILIIVLSIFFYRPFCKYLCPLGAFYALTNKFSFYQYHVNDSCISCGKCKKVCKMDVDMSKNQRALECIRCGDCIKACPTSAISTSFKNKNFNKGDINEKYLFEDK